MTGQPGQFFQCFCPLNKWWNCSHLNRSDRPVPIDFLLFQYFVFYFFVATTHSTASQIVKKCLHQTCFTNLSLGCYKGKLGSLFFESFSNGSKNAKTKTQILKCSVKFDRRTKIAISCPKHLTVLQTVAVRVWKNKLWFILIDLYLLDYAWIIEGIKNNKTETCEWKKTSLSSDNQG